MARGMNRTLILAVLGCLCACAPAQARRLSELDDLLGDEGTDPGQTAVDDGAGALDDFLNVPQPGADEGEDKSGFTFIKQVDLSEEKPYDCDKLSVVLINLSEKHQDATLAMQWALLHAGFEVHVFGNIDPQYSAQVIADHFPEGRKWMPVNELLKPSADIWGACPEHNGFDVVFLVTMEWDIPALTRTRKLRTAFTDMIERLKPRKIVGCFHEPMSEIHPEGPKHVANPAYAEMSVNKMHRFIKHYFITGRMSPPALEYVTFSPLLATKVRAAFEHPGMPKDKPVEWIMPIVPYKARMGCKDKDFRSFRSDCRSGFSFLGEADTVNLKSTSVINLFNETFKSRYITSPLPRDKAFQVKLYSDKEHFQPLADEVADATERNPEPPDPRKGNGIVEDLGPLLTAIPQHSLPELYLEVSRSCAVIPWEADVQSRAPYSVGFAISGGAPILAPQEFLDAYGFLTSTNSFVKVANETYVEAMTKYQKTRGLYIERVRANLGDLRKDLFTRNHLLLNAIVKNLDRSSIPGSSNWVMPDDD